MSDPHPKLTRVNGRTLAAFAILPLVDAAVAYVAFFLLPFTIGHIVGGTMSHHLVPMSELLAGLTRAVTLGCVLGVVPALVFWFVGVRGTSVPPAVSLTEAP